MLVYRFLTVIVIPIILVVIIVIVIVIVIVVMDIDDIIFADDTFVIDMIVIIITITPGLSVRSRGVNYIWSWRLLQLIANTAIYLEFARMKPSGIVKEIWNISQDQRHNNFV